MPSPDLAGILVVSVEQAVAAPYLSCCLADAGARVIKIERPEGDFARGYDRIVKGESAYFVWLNRGKESVCLDLRTPSDRAALARIIARADVFIQNLAPGAIGRLGFDPDALRKQHRGLITVSISGYGNEGPNRHQKAYDLLVQAETGLCAITGTPDGMARVGVSVGDIAAGTTALNAVLQALFARTRSGKGRHIDVSLFHALGDWMNVPYLQYAYGGKQAPRAGLQHPTIAPYGAFACADESAVLLGVQNEREWHRFCAMVLVRPDLADDTRFVDNSARIANRADLDALIQAALAKLPRNTVIRRLQDANIACGKVSSLEDLAQHPQNRYVTIHTPAGPVQVLAPGALVDNTPLSPGPVPQLGSHTEAVLAEFGSSEPEDELSRGNDTA